MLNALLCVLFVATGRVCAQPLGGITHHVSRCTLHPTFPRVFIYFFGFTLFHSLSILFSVVLLLDPAATNLKGVLSPPSLKFNSKALSLSELMCTPGQGQFYKEKLDRWDTLPTCVLRWPLYCWNCCASTQASLLLQQGCCPLHLLHGVCLCWLSI